MWRRTVQRCRIQSVPSNDGHVGATSNSSVRSAARSSIAAHGRSRPKGEKTTAKKVRPCLTWRLRTWSARADDTGAPLLGGPRAAGTWPSVARSVGAYSARDGCQRRCVLDGCARQTVPATRRRVADSRRCAAAAAANWFEGAPADTSARHPRDVVETFVSSGTNVINQT